MTVKIVDCGGCERPSLLEDIEAAGERDETGIDESHCPRCGTRLENDVASVETYSADDDRSEDVHWIHPESLEVFDETTAALLDRLAEASGTATLRELADDDTDVLEVSSKLQLLFELDVDDYDLDLDDPDGSEIELAHETIRVMPLVVDGERPSMRDALTESLGDGVVPEGVLENGE